MKKNIEHKGKKQFVEEFIEMMNKEFGNFTPTVVVELPQNSMLTNDNN